MIKRAATLFAALTLAACGQGAVQEPTVPRSHQAEIPPEVPQAEPKAAAPAAPRAEAGPEAQAAPDPDQVYVGVDIHKPESWGMLAKEDLEGWMAGFALDVAGANIRFDVKKEALPADAVIGIVHVKACSVKERVCSEPSDMPGSDAKWFTFTSPGENGAVVVRDVISPGVGQLIIFAQWVPEGEAEGRQGVIDVVTKTKTFKYKLGPDGRPVTVE